MGDEEDRKLFVGGLPQEVSQDDLKEYFEGYGELDHIKLKMDPNTGRSRGFAFILFKDEDGINAAADGSEHKMKGKTITVKKADVRPGKVYVGKLPDNGCGEEEIKSHFEQYGTVTEVIRPIDKMKNNEPKNFCFVTFEKERVAKKMIEEGNCVINGNKMNIKQVTPNPRDPTQRGAMGGAMMGGRGGGQRGGGRGGFGGSPWMNSQGGGYGGGGGWGGDQGGFGGGQWGAQGAGGYGGNGGGFGGEQWGGQQGGYGGGGGYGGQQGGFGGGGYGGGMGGGGGGNTWSGDGGGKMRGGRGGGGGGGGRGRGGAGGGNRGRPY